VPPDDPESNYRMAQEVLLSRISIPVAQVHRMPADRDDRDAASLDYTREMQRVFGTTGIPEFDLLQLGMGPEGHTASLFPHQPSLHETQRLVMPVSVPKPPPDRVSLSLGCLQNARRVIFLVTGADKAEAVVKASQGEVPSGMVPDAEYLLDRAAASRL